jgi:hypothetical protein
MAACCGHIAGPCHGFLVPQLAACCGYIVMPCHGFLILQVDKYSLWLSFQYEFLSPYRERIICPYAFNCFMFQGLETLDFNRWNSSSSDIHHHSLYYSDQLY